MPLSSVTGTLVSLVQEGWGLLLSCGIKEPEHPGAGNALQMCLETA